MEACHTRIHDDGLIIHEVADGTRTILNDVGNNSRAVLNEAANGTRAGIKETADASRVGIKETADASRFGIRETADVGRALASDICRSSHEEIEATREQAHETRETIEDARASAERFNFAAREAVERGFIETRLGQERIGGEIRRDNLSSFSALDKYLCSKFETVDRDILLGNKEILVESLKGFNQIEKNQDRLAAAAQLAAAQNQAATLAAIAECCCEQKELTRDQANQTRDLINNLNTQRLQDEINSLKLRVAIPTFPV